MGMFCTRRRELFQLNEVPLRAVLEKGAVGTGVVRGVVLPGAGVTENWKKGWKQTSDQLLPSSMTPSFHLDVSRKLFLKLGLMKVCLAYNTKVGVTDTSLKGAFFLSQIKAKYFKPKGENDILWISERNKETFFF